jgi:hypothetical protein
MIRYNGPPMTLGNAAAAHVRFIVWCLDCRDQVELAPGRVGRALRRRPTVPDWRARLVCGRCGSRRVDMIVIVGSALTAPCGKHTYCPVAIVKQIVDAKAQFRSLAEPWADTGTGRLMRAVLGGLADVERDLISTRTAEGRCRAKAQGKHMGRPPPLTPEQQKEAARRRAEALHCKNWQTSTNVGISTIRRHTRAARPTQT